MNIYVNLAVADLDRSRRFYAALGFSFDERFSDSTAAALTLNDKAGIMLLTREKFQSFTPRALADTATTCQTLLALQLDSREAVDTMVAAALSNGGASVREVQDMGFMYHHAFADPDGHIFEPFVMDMAAIEPAEVAQ